MTRDEVRAALVTIISQQQGRGDGQLGTQRGEAKNLQEAFDITSLDVVSIQVAIEDQLGLKFATGHADRGPIDAAWDAAKSLDDLVQLVLTFRC